MDLQKELQRTEKLLDNLLAESGYDKALNRRERIQKALGIIFAKQETVTRNDTVLLVLKFSKIYNDSVQKTELSNERHLKGFIRNAQRGQRFFTGSFEDALERCVEPYGYHTLGLLAGITDVTLNALYRAFKDLGNHDVKHKPTVYTDLDMTGCIHAVRTNLSNVHNACITLLNLEQENEAFIKRRAEERNTSLSQMLQGNKNVP